MSGGKGKVRQLEHLKVLLSGGTAEAGLELCHQSKTKSRRVPKQAS